MKLKRPTCSTGHGTGRHMPASYAKVRRRLPRMRLRAVLSEKEAASRLKARKALHVKRMQRGAAADRVLSRIARYMGFGLREPITIEKAEA